MSDMLTAMMDLEIKELIKKIEKLEKRVAQLERDAIMLPADIPYLPKKPTELHKPCLQDGDHEYPRFWGGITPPPSTKCGKPASSWPAVTCSIPT